MKRLILSILLVGIIFSFACQASSATEQTLTLNRALFMATDSSVSPDIGWQPVSLPDSWQVRQPDLSGFAWYRLAFTLNAPPSQPLVLYVPHVSLVASFWLNGSLLNPEDTFDRPNGKIGSQMSDVPVYLTLPSGLFHPGENVLDIRLQGDSRIHSGISAPMVGPISDLGPRRAMRYAMQVTIPKIILAVGGAALCFLGAHLLRQRRLHGIQVALLASCATGVAYLAVQLPVGREGLLLLRVASNLLMHWTLIVAAYRMADLRAKWFLPLWHIITALTATVVAWYAVTDAVTDRIWMVTWPHLLLRFVVVYLVLQKAWRERSIKFAALAITGGFWLLTLVQSYLLLMDVFPWDHFRTSPAGFAPFCLVLLYVCAEKFIQDKEETASAQRGAITAERSRIMQEMHDGMGAHLITALHLARRVDIARHELIGSIEESLQDLRSIIDSMDLAGEDLLPLLANLRTRIEPRLNALGISLVWDVAMPFPEVKGLTPQTSLNILRVVQECFNNAIQHSSACLIHFIAHPQDSKLCISISDDGRGFDTSAPRTGARGLTGMRTRAESLKGSINIRSGTEGTTIELRIPLAQKS